MSGSSSDSRGSGADALDCEAMARIWRGVRAAAPSTGGESEEEDREERGNREGVFLFFFALGVNIHIIFFQGVHSNTVYEIGRQNSRQVQVGPTWRAT